jgi:hypothetical protein
MKSRFATALLGALAISILMLTQNAYAAGVTSDNYAICNQTVGNSGGVTATRLYLGECLVTFTTAGVANSWTAPAGVTSIQLLVVGGGGGGGIDGGSGGGGGGAYQTSATAVTPSSVYNVYVGNGGGPGIYSPTTSPTAGESSTITINGTVFAGLGGAAAANGISTNPQPAAAVGGGFQGTGGTGTNGATGGAGIGWGSGITGPGSNGIDGNLTSSITDRITDYGGSGAGGGNMAGLSSVAIRRGGAGGGGDSTYLAGGSFTAASYGAANTGGGGGGGLSNSTNISYKSSAGGGSGIVVLRYTPNTSTSISLNLGAAAFVFRQNATITSTTGIAGTVNFKANGKYIPGCRNRPSNSGNSYTATCTFKPASHIPIAITAQFTPTDSTYKSSSVSVIKYSIQARAITR